MTPRRACRGCGHEPVQGRVTVVGGSDEYERHHTVSTVPCRVCVPKRAVTR